MLRKIRNLVYFSLIGALALFSITGCESPTNSTTPLTDIVPEFGFSQDASKAVARVATNTNMTNAEAVYAILAPALTGFKTVASGVSNGQKFKQSLMGVDLEITAEHFKDGTNGIASGVRFTGVLADGSGTVLLELEPSTKQFYYEQKLFVDDTVGIFMTNYPQKMINWYVLSGTVDTANKSNFATGKTAVLMVANHPQSGFGTYAQIVNKVEFYNGEWDTEGATGTGVAFRSGTMMPGPNVLGGTALTTLDAVTKAQLDAGIQWLQETYNSINESGWELHPMIVYKSSKDAEPARWDINYDYDNPPPSETLLNEAQTQLNTVSSVWSSKSTIFK